MFDIRQVADLKLELKQRGLPTTGNKNELVERLQLAMHGGLFRIHRKRVFHLVSPIESLDQKFFL